MTHTERNLLLVISAIVLEEQRQKREVSPWVDPLLHRFLAIKCSKGHNPSDELCLLIEKCINDVRAEMQWNCVPRDTDQQ